MAADRSLSETPGRAICRTITSRRGSSTVAAASNTHSGDAQSLRALRTPDLDARAAAKRHPFLESGGDVRQDVHCSRASAVTGASGTLPVAGGMPALGGMMACDHASSYQRK